MNAWVTCSAAYGAGGLGRHLGELVEDLRGSGELHGYFSAEPKAGDEAIGRPVKVRGERWVLNWTPLRFSPGWRNFAACELFDRVVARLPRPGTPRYIGFVGQSLHSFRAARRSGTECLELVAANSHVRNVRRLHAMALKRYPIESSWLNQAQQAKTLHEYRMADRIQVTSDYSWASLVAEGVPEHKLYKFRLTPHPRFRPPASRPDDGIFRVVYVGSLTAAKGIPVLIEAFGKLAQARTELTLVGGWASRGMRRYCSAMLARCPNIRVVRGDPLPILQRANVFVHPTFEDGFAYAPAEALACGVPVIVTADTGMKELVQDGVNGYVVPTGDVDALAARLEHLQRHPLRFVP